MKVICRDYSLITMRPTKIIAFKIINNHSVNNRVKNKQLHDHRKHCNQSRKQGPMFARIFVVDQQNEDRILMKLADYTKLELKKIKQDHLISYVLCVSIH
jgi:hypothetical protein